MLLRKANITLLLVLICLHAFCRKHKKPDATLALRISVASVSTLSDLKANCDGAVVHITCNRHKIDLTATTDSSGTVTFTNLPRGHYNLSCIKPDIDTLYTYFGIYYVQYKHFIFTRKYLHAVPHLYEDRLRQGNDNWYEDNTGHLCADLYIYKKHGVKLIPYVSASN